MKTICCVPKFLAFTLMFLTASIFAQDVKTDFAIEGAWNVTFSSENFRFPALVEFVRKDSKLFGYVNPPQGIEINFTEVKLEQNLLKIKGNAVYNKTSIPISLTGTVSANSLSGNMKIPFIGEVSMKGMRLPNEFSNVSRAKIFDDVSELIEKKFYSPTYNGLNWNLEKKLYREKVLASQSFSEMNSLIREMLSKLNASHLAFYPILPNAEKVEAELTTENIEWKKVTENIGYIKVREFSDETTRSANQIKKAFDELNDLSSLIIDLRNNPGGSLDVGLPLGEHLFQGKQCVGYFYSRVRATKMKTDSLAELKRQNFPVFANAILPQNTDASKLVINGLANKAYKGKVVILINEADYSTTEAFAAAFKESRRGILIGKKTAGAMLAKDVFSIGKFWILEMPVADFRTCSGVKVEGNGVKPDVEVEEENSGDAALAKAISLLKK